MTTSSWRLTVEEIAFLISMRNQPAIAQGTMRVQLGPLTKENIEGRLYAAGHSLIARGELAVAADGSIHVGEDMALLTDILLDSPHSLRFTRTYRNAELLLTYHFYRGAIYEHRLVQGVVHEIEAVANSAAVAVGGVAFFGLDEASIAAQAETTASCEIDAAVWNELSVQNEYPQLIAKVRALTVLNGAGEWLAQDLLSANYRGTVLWVSYTEDKQPISDHGFLVLNAPQRTWLVEPKQAVTGDATAEIVQVQLCNADILKAKVQELCQLA